MEQTNGVRKEKKRLDVMFTIYIELNNKLNTFSIVYKAIRNDTRYTLFT